MRTENLGGRIAIGNKDGRGDRVSVLVSRDRDRGLNENWKRFPPSCVTIIPTPDFSVRIGITVKFSGEL